MNFNALKYVFPFFFKICSHINKTTTSSLENDSIDHSSRQLNRCICIISIYLHKFNRYYLLSYQINKNKNLFTKKKLLITVNKMDMMQLMHHSQYSYRLSLIHKSSKFPYKTNGLSPPFFFMPPMDDIHFSRLTCKLGLLHTRTS